MTAGRWTFDPEYETWTIQGRHCSIWMIARPAYCDRGRWLAHVEKQTADPRILHIDGADGWPRYYFDLDRAKAECEAWLRIRGEEL